MIERVQLAPETCLAEEIVYKLGNCEKRQTTAKCAMRTHQLTYCVLVKYSEGCPNLELLRHPVQRVWRRAAAEAAEGSGDCHIPHSIYDRLAP